MTAPLTRQRVSKERLGSGKSSSVLPAGVHSNVETTLTTTTAKRKTTMNNKGSARKEKRSMNGSKSLLDFSKVAAEVAPIHNIFASNGGTGGASSTNNAAKKSQSSDFKGGERNSNLANVSLNNSKRSVKQNSKRTKK